MSEHVRRLVNRYDWADRLDTWLLRHCGAYYRWRMRATS